MGESVCLVRSLSQPAEISSREINEVVPHRVLTESVSFGRFASESLQWDKWSAFTQNRFLEEVERFTKPGSVAQKKAFFEAHFKNRAAARKTQTKIEEVNICEIRKENHVDSEVALVVNNGMTMNEVRHEEVSNAEVDSVVQSDTDEALDVENLNLSSMAVPENEALDEENSTSLSKERLSSSSGTKACSSKLQPSFVIGLDTSFKKSIKEPPSGSVPFHMSINNDPSGSTDKKVVGIPQNGSRSSTNANGVAKVVKKKRSGPSSVHISLNFASSTRQTSKTAPSNLGRNSTTQERTSSNARNSIFPNGNKPTGALKSSNRPLPRTSKEGSKAAKCSTSASAVRFPKLSPNNHLSENKRKNITVGSSVSCRIPNNEKRQTSVCCENLSNHSRTREKCITVSSPFNFQSDKRAEKRKEFFKKLEENNKKEDAVKQQLSCSFKVPLISLTSPRFSSNQTPGAEKIQKSHKPPQKVSLMKTINTRNVEKHKRCKIYPSLTKKKTQENLSPNILQK